MRYAIRARELTKGKDASVLGYVAEASGFNHDYEKATDAAREGLVAIPVKLYSAANCA